MKDDTRKPPITDATDIDALWDDPMLGDGITDEELLSVGWGMPKGKFVRTHPDRAYRRRAHIYCPPKKDGDYTGEIFLIHPKMLKHMEEEARPCVLVTVVDREFNPTVWPLKLEREGEKECNIWTTARIVARRCIDTWGKAVWTGRGYKFRGALPGYAGEPPWSKLPPFDDLVRVATAGRKIIDSTDHPVYREEFGLPQEDRKAGESDDTIDE